MDAVPSKHQGKSSMSSLAESNCKTSKPILGPSHPASKGPAIGKPLAIASKLKKDEGHKHKTKGVVPSEDKVLS